jgi:hexulose-6-phosphate isomerase
MNRRHFLASSAAALASTLIHPAKAQAQTTASSSGTSTSPLKPLKKAVNLGMVKGPAGASIEDRFKMARDAGFDGLELNLPDEKLSVDILQKAKEASGLEIAGIICTPHWSFPLSDPDPSKRERTVKGLQLALQQGGELGCKRVLLVPGVVTAQVNYDQCWERSVEGIKRCVETAEKSKCAIAIENVWNKFIQNASEAARYVDTFHSPWVGWHFDIGNCVINSWPEHWPQILGKRIINLHIKEFSRKKANDEGMYKGFGVELGEGDVNWPLVMQALRDTSYQGYGIAEVGGGDMQRLQFLSERMSKLLNG